MGAARGGVVQPSPLPRCGRGCRKAAGEGDVGRSWLVAWHLRRITGFTIVSTPMKARLILRWAKRVVLFLIVGAVATTLIAWTAAIAGGLQSSDQPVRRGHTTHGTTFSNWWTFEWNRRAGRIVGSNWSGPGLRFNEVTPKLPQAARLVPRDAAWGRAQSRGGEDGLHKSIVVVYGWPFPALVGGWNAVRIEPLSQELRRSGAPDQYDLTAHFAFVLRAAPYTAPGTLGWERSVVLPYRPRISGFAANTGIFAAVAWICWMTPSAVTAARRCRRAARRCCGSCGHPLAGSAVCPECGTNA